MSHDLERIRRILLAEWDPIGVADVREAQDEYDSYALHVRSLIAAGTSVQAVADYLHGIEIGAMGLAGDRDRAYRVAAILMG